MYRTILSLWATAVLLLVVCPQRTTQSSWTTATLSEARYSLAATSVGDLALFAGGQIDASSVSDAVDIYNASSGIWTQTTLSLARSHLAAASTGNLAFFAGGLDVFGATSNVVDVYDASSNTWNVATLSQARSHLAAASAGNVVIFAMGSSDGTSAGVLTRVDIYDTVAKNWTITSLSQARFQLAATSTGRLAIFAGGSDASSVLSAVDIYDSFSGSWYHSTLSQPRDNLAATAVGDLAVFAGGDTTSNSDASSLVEVYNFSSVSPVLVTSLSLSEARYSMAATSVGGSLAVFAGGWSTDVSSSVDTFNSSTLGISSAKALSIARYALAATSVNSAVALFAGGYGASGAGTQVDMFVLASPSPSSSPSPTSSPPHLPSVSVSATPTASVSATPSPSVSATPSSVPIPSAVVVPTFNLTVPAVAISGQSSSGAGQSGQKVDLNLVSLEEISSLDNTTVLQSIDLQTVGWTFEQNNGSATGSVENVFTSELSAATNGTNNATIQYVFNTFNSTKLITTGSEYSFTVNPALLKFSLNVTSWQWNSTSGKLRLTMRINPSFVQFTRWNDSPQTGMTTFLFSSSDNTEQASTVVRLLNFAETPAGADGGGLSSRLAMEASAVVATSSLSLTFDHFNDTLSFDPDFGLLLGGSNARGGGSGDDVGLIVGVSVAIPVAVVVVVAVIVVGLVAIVVKRRMEQASSRGAVDIDAELETDEYHL